MAQEARAALEQGLIDAAAFVGGAAGGWLLGRAFGVDALAGSGLDTSTVIGLVFVLAGCAVGKLAAQRWSRQRAARRS